MERLTFEGNFCDIAMCRENPCPYNGSCSQKETWERLKAYEDAEEAGRLLKLPCKVGDEVYLNMDGETYPLKVQGISVAAGSIGCVIHFGGWPVMNAWGSDFGKILFSTKEEAEAALNKKAAENER